VQRLCATEKLSLYQGFGLENTILMRSRRWECKPPVSSCALLFQCSSNFRNVDELRGLSSKSAMQHRFHVSPQFYPRGPVDALRELKEAGCHLATQEWVDNHWSLILWKLASMAALDPESEVNINRRRWSWSETIRQLQYRYVSSVFCFSN
jgi:hypothetical protein